MPSAGGSLGHTYQSPTLWVEKLLDDQEPSGGELGVGFLGSGPQGLQPKTGRSLA